MEKTEIASQPNFGSYRINIGDSEEPIHLVCANGIKIALGKGGTKPDESYLGSTVTVTGKKGLCTVSIDLIDAVKIVSINENSRYSQQHNSVVHHAAFKAPPATLGPSANLKTNDGRGLDAVKNTRVFKRFSTTDNDISELPSSSASTTSADAPSPVNNLVPALDPNESKTFLKVAAILMQFENKKSSETPEAFLERIFYGSAGQGNGVTQFFNKYSNGGIEFGGLATDSMTPDLFGWITLPILDTSNCNIDDWKTDVQEIAGISKDNAYDHLVFSVNTAPACENMMGYADFPGKQTFIRNDVKGKHSYQYIPNQC